MAKNKIGMISDSLYHWSNFNSDRNELNEIQEIKEPINKFIDKIYCGGLNHLFQSESGNLFLFADEKPANNDYQVIDTNRLPAEMSHTELDEIIQSTIYFLSSLLCQKENELVGRMSTHALLLK